MGPEAAVPGERAGDVSKYEEIEHDFWFVMRIWVLVMLAGFTFGFWLLFCKAEAVDPKIKAAHEQHIKNILEARKVGNHYMDHDEEKPLLRQRKNAHKGMGDMSSELPL